MVNRRTACELPIDWLGLAEAGRVLRPSFQDRDGYDVPAVSIGRVLCWWCREYHSPAEVERCMALPRKVAAANGSTSSTSNALDAGLLKQYSELWAFLTQNSFEDGLKRRTGRISVSCESDMLGLLLTDDETGQYAFLNGRKLDDLLAEAEIRLSDGSLSWRPSRYGSRKK